MMLKRLRAWLLTIVAAVTMTATVFAIGGAFALTSCSSKGTYPQYNPTNPTVERIVQRGKLLVGTTGDYRPLSFYEPETGEYWGFGIEMVQAIADRIGVKVEFVRTSWPTLTADVLAEPQLFDLAIGGITITDARQEIML